MTIYVQMYSKIFEYPNICPTLVWPLLVSTAPLDILELPIPFQPNFLLSRHGGPAEREHKRLRAARHQAAQVQETTPVIPASSVTVSVISAYILISSNISTVIK